MSTVKFCWTSLWRIVLVVPQFLRGAECFPHLVTSLAPSTTRSIGSTLKLHVALKVAGEIEARWYMTKTDKTALEDPLEEIFVCKFTVYPEFECYPPLTLRADVKERLPQNFSGEVEKPLRQLKLDLKIIDLQASDSGVVGMHVYKFNRTVAVPPAPILTTYTNLLVTTCPPCPEEGVTTTTITERTGKRKKVCEKHMYDCKAKMQCTDLKTTAPLGDPTLAVCLENATWSEPCPACELPNIQVQKAKEVAETATKQPTTTEAVAEQSEENTAEESSVIGAIGIVFACVVALGVVVGIFSVCRREAEYERPEEAGDGLDTRHMLYMGQSVCPVVPSLYAGGRGHDNRMSSVMMDDEFTPIATR